MNKKLIVIAIALVIAALPVYAAVNKATLINSNGDKAVVTVGSSEAQKYFGSGYVLMGSPYKQVEKVCDCEKVGAIPGGDIVNEINAMGGLKYRNVTKAIAKTSIYSTTTLQVADSGTTYLISASGTSIYLPTATSSKGVWYRFVVGDAITTASTTIYSGTSDTIEGSILVAGAIVDCNAADVITIGDAGENIGDFVEMVSTGTYWVPLASGFTTAALTTCSG